MKGFTIAEVLVAAVLVAVMVAGTLMAFVGAARMSVRGGPAFMEATGYAQQLLESARNRRAADDAWFTDASRLRTVPQPWSNWADDDGPMMVGGGTNAIGPAAVRKYLVSEVDCDNDAATPGPCHAVFVKVCWNEPGC